MFTFQVPPLLVAYVARHDGSLLLFSMRFFAVACFFAIDFHFAFQATSSPDFQIGVYQPITFGPADWALDW